MPHKNAGERNAYYAAYRAANKGEISAKKSAFYNAHKQEINAKHAIYRSANKEKLRVGSVAYRAAHKEELRAKDFKKRYGISIECWDSFFELVKGKCPVCKSVFTKSRKRKAVVHHCHTSGHVHGLICNACNLAEGLLETPESVLALYNYMMQSELLSYQPNGKEGR